ncbi:uncharacterized protein LOC132717147 [Ruditapes philippinarum]|uniref:uncharacterized protein LOC132717147 n=1 Tax=Ruditapes philippinarum TaxID=129788 RepID=UPI00295ACF59|nr:uncharacterized protein LOC132717147 [Ruditapes philippinarum]
MVHPTRKRKSSAGLEDNNDLPRQNKRRRCRTLTSQTRASAPQSKAPTSSPRAHTVATTPNRPAKSSPMAHIYPLNAPTLSPRTSKPSPTVMGQQPLEQDQQKVKETMCMIHGVSEEVQAVDKGPENDTLDIGKTKNAKLCQNIDTSDKNPFEYLSVDTNEIWHYKVPLKRLPRKHRLHGLVGTLIDYSEDIEKELGLPNMDESGMEHLDDINMFIQNNTFDMKLLIEDREDLYRTNTEISQIASRTKSVARSKAVGLFVKTEGIQFVESVTDSTIFVYSDSQIKKEKEHANAISSLMEVTIMRPLIGKVAIFHKLLGIAYSQRNSEDISASAIVKEFPYLYSNLSPSSITAIETNSSDEFFKCIQENKSNIERMLGEMIALANRSGLPEEIMPVIKEYQTAVVSKEVAMDLFKLDTAITWCGFRYRTFHIYVKHNESEDKELAEKISKFVATHGIMKYEVIYIDGDLEEYSYIGSMISPKIQNSKETKSKGQGKVQRKVQGGAQKKTEDHHATLGCFATFKQGNCSSICALISKHFANHLGNGMFDKDIRLLGRVIPVTLDQGHYDIAAAKIVDDRVLNLDTNFRNYDGEIKRAILVDVNKAMQNQAVYLRGAKTKLGVGTIEIPFFIKSDGKYYIKVKPGSLEHKEPCGRLAEEGDSGAILCYDDLDQNLKVCGMLMGKCCEGESYCFLPLSHALEQLNESTNGEFKLITHMENSPAQIHAVGDYLQASGSCKYLTD